MSSSGNFILKSAENDSFVINRGAALLSNTIKNFLDDGCNGDDDMVIPVPNISSKILPKVLEYCNKHAHANDDQSDGDKKGKEVARDDDHSDQNLVEELKNWEAKYMDIDQEVLYHLMVAANYLDIKGLLDLTVEKAANMIKGKTVEAIRETFNIKNDFDPEEEENIRKKNQWAFE